MLTNWIDDVSNIQVNADTLTGSGNKVYTFKMCHSVSSVITIVVNHISNVGMIKNDKQADKAYSLGFCFNYLDQKEAQIRTVIT